MPKAPKASTNTTLNTVPKLTRYLVSVTLLVPKKHTNQVYPSCSTKSQIRDNSTPNIPATTSVTASA